MRARFSCWLAALLLSGCAKYHTVNDVNDLSHLPGAARVIVADVRPSGDTISRLAPGLYIDADLVLEDKLPLRDGMPLIHAQSGHTVVSKLGRRGGVVPIGVGAEALYVLGIRTASTSVLWDTTGLLPMLALVPNARGRCEYIGTFYVWSEGRQVDFEIRDELEANRAALESRVRGCQLVSNLARKLTPQDFGQAPGAASTSAR